MILHNLITFSIGILSALFFIEFSPIQTESYNKYYNKYDRASLLECEKDSVVIYSSPSCRYCSEFHVKCDDIIKKYNNNRFNIRYVDISVNVLDAIGSSIIMHSNNPEKMRKHIFKTQQIWFNENDILLSSRKLIDLCSRLESIDLQKIYSKIPILIKETRDLCSSLGHEALPTVLLVKKLEGVRALKNMTDIFRFGSLYVR
ncbi:hypothetical protein FZC35_02275 [Candidatus Cytomitobacter indipagum]|uniref:Thioredoxin-like fold domain-containing protein n=1 Tax=Candidatus Cytomitobacter indipagum TaxID=2601575 RepID=A0A5C0UDQ4_9PROT|nr:thioredoxin domain-containing protein [Candidatus Cytomitobacter indipagum]QEK38185.1 hypothetical protein FZC35_02275 [Candidatus Cytomitobacter indipagum]